MRLYHGSNFNQKEIKPSYQHTGELEEWDDTESNEWLYATTDKELSGLMAIASYMGRHYLVNRFSTGDRSIEIEFEKGEDLSKANKELYNIPIVIYELQLDDKWELVNNSNNQDVPEYKSKESFTKFKKQVYNSKELLMGFEVKLLTSG